MDKKMTSGEIAKRAGVSQKAVRLYDEKGLLKPAEYSDGNYRLYDQGSLQILEKIVALKQIGFSLEEIRDNITSGEASDIEGALRMQLAAMEEKRDQITKVIDVIQRTLERDAGSLDWDDVAGIVQSIHLDQRADKFHLDSVKHQISDEDWYTKIFRSLDLQPDSRVLDLGCGFAKLWRNNWSEIPEGMQISAYDVHGSWADNFAEFLEENKAGLPSGVKIDLEFADLEEEATWKKIGKSKKFDRIVAHYLSYELKDPDALVAAASGVLAKDGFFSYNGPNVSSWGLFFMDAANEMGIAAPFMQELLVDQQKKKEACETMLLKHFKRIEVVSVRNDFRYTDAEELLAKMKDVFQNQEKFFNKNQDKILSFFREKIEKDGEVRVAFEAKFSHCYLH
ncbi:MAG: MerR family transcriptional regulator [Clostridiales bacterium]|nr:MerR family transcriptional regulator [Clostridiales bacterium]